MYFECRMIATSLMNLISNGHRRNVFAMVMYSNYCANTSQNTKGSCIDQQNKMFLRA